MRFVGVVTAGMLAAVLGAGVVQARSLDVNEPVELPGANFKDRQYVDSSGCVFIRAGYGGNVTWVPRVGRSGDHVCGYKPSLSAGAPVIAMTAGEATQAPVSAPPAPARPAPARPAPQVTAAAPVVVAPQKAAGARPLFGAARPGAPMPTIALTTTPPKIGLAAATAARTSTQAPSVMISGTGSAVTLTEVAPPVAPVAGPEVPMVATAAGAGGYVSPYVSAEVAAAEAERRANPYVALVPARSGNPRTQTNSSGASTAARARTMASPQPAAPVAIISQDPLPGGYAACPNLSPIAQRYMMSNGRGVVRCGPQAEDPVSYLNTIQVPGLPAVAGIAPAMPAIPAGYSAVWHDDRLNPARAMGTPEGNAQMAMLWDDHVPARLRSRQPQVAAPVTRVTMSASNMPAPRRVAKPVTPAGYATAMAATQQQPGDAPTQRLMQAARYVQVGTFAEPGNAEASRARLRALGLPVATSQLTQKGRALQVVLAGPFADTPTLVMALSNARAAGFQDAFAR